MDIARKHTVYTIYTPFSGGIIFVQLPALEPNTSVMPRSLKHRLPFQSIKTENRTQVSGVSFENKFALKRKVLSPGSMKPKKKKKFRTASQLGLYLKN